MNVYEDLILQLRQKEQNHTSGGSTLCGAAADAIETLLKEIDKTVEISAFDAAKRDIAALLWLEGRCDYCKYGAKDEYSGANRWFCTRGGIADCKPRWRYDDAEEG